mgnify:CR=1 FL=1
MQSENNVQLKLDISEAIDHANSVENPWEKLRYLRQFTRLLAVYAEHESFQVDELIAKLPEKFREEVWEIYTNELELERTKTDPTFSVENKIDINIIAKLKAQREKPKVTIKPKKKEEEVSQKLKKDEHVRKKQKTKRTNQLHELIMKIAVEIAEDLGKKPSSRKLMKKIERDYLEYDEDAIIQEVTGKGIYWKSKYGYEQDLAWSSFAATFSRLWKNKKINAKK